MSKYRSLLTLLSGIAIALLGGLYIVFPASTSGNASLRYASFPPERLAVNGRLYLPSVLKASTLPTPPPRLVLAQQNLAADPGGRVVDVTFSREHALTAPWDRYRFDIDIIQPLARDSGAFLGDLSGDGILDLLLASWSGETLYFPGIPGKPRRFSDGRYLKRVTDNISKDPYHGVDALWLQGDVGDLDGDGKKDIVIGIELFSNAGTASEPVLQYKYTFDTPEYAWDPAPSLGDLNANGKLDVLITYNGQSYIYWNNSTPGVFQFTRQLLHTWTTGGSNERPSLGDLNGDSKLDLAWEEGIYYNTGTAASPSYNFGSPAAWNKTGGPSWSAASDQPVHVFLKDGDGDGRTDVYLSNLSSTVWQVLFYKNTGSATAHHLQYAGPVVASASPMDAYYRGHTTPNISGSRPYIAAGDVDRNGLPDVLLSTNGGDYFGAPTILWNSPDESGSPVPRVFSYQDLYTYPVHSRIDYTCGVGPFGTSDALCKPPNLFSAWINLAGDSQPDVLRLDDWAEAFTLFSRVRSGSWPFTLAGDSPFNTSPSGAQATALGVALVDVNLDGRPDLVGGTQDGRLLYYRNTSTTALSLADPVYLSSAGISIDVGNQSWPAPFDLDGDGDEDFLVANDEGLVYKVFNQTPGSSTGYSLGGLLGVAEQAPLDVTHIVGGGTLVPSLATLDVDGDNRQDVLMGDALGRIWLLRNTGTFTAPTFSLRPLLVSRTASAYLEILDARHARLYFALPITPGETFLGYHGVPTSSGSISGEITITAP